MGELLQHYVHIEIFEKLRLGREKLWSYKGSNLKAFNDTLTYPMGYTELTVIISKGRDTRRVDLQFLEISYKSARNYNLGRPFATTMDVMASLVHIELKYHNVHDEKAKIGTEFLGSQRIHKAMKCDQKGNTKRS